MESLWYGAERCVAYLCRTGVVPPSSVCRYQALRRPRLSILKRVVDLHDDDDASLGEFETTMELLHWSKCEDREIYAFVDQHSQGDRDPHTLDRICYMFIRAGLLVPLRYMFKTYGAEQCFVNPSGVISAAITAHARDTQIVELVRYLHEHLDAVIIQNKHLLRACRFNMIETVKYMIFDLGMDYGLDVFIEALEDTHSGDVFRYLDTFGPPLDADEINHELNDAITATCCVRIFKYLGTRWIPCPESCYQVMLTSGKWHSKIDEAIEYVHTTYGYPFTAQHLAMAKGDAKKYIRCNTK